jgi:hypothetical protein
VPGKHKNRKRSRPRELQVKVHLAIPKQIGTEAAKVLLERNLASGYYGKAEDWGVDIEWKNPNTKVGRSREWQRGDWTTVLQDSSGSPGFAMAVRNALRAARGKAPLKPKAKPEKQLPLFPKPKAKAKKRKPTEKQVKARRSAAARKGWKTRRANAAKKGGK